MQTLLEGIRPDTVAGGILVLAVVGALGCALGNLRIFGIRFGIAGVMFVGILLGHFRVGLNDHLLEFAREFGLILFVYAVGLQVAPGFFASLRKEGFTLNFLAVLNVLLAVLITIGFTILGRVHAFAAVGILCGATTNTPSLAAAQTTLKDLLPNNTDVIAMPALGYAVSYPFGIIGIILTMLLIRRVFHVNVAKEDHELSRTLCLEVHPVERRNIKVENPAAAGKSVKELLKNMEGIVLSRIFHDGQLSVVLPDTCLALDDVVLAVGQRHRLNALEALLGGASEIDLTDMKGPVRSRQIVVTSTAVVGKTTDELGLDIKFGVQITRIRRGEIDLTPSPGVRLQFADVVMAVGTEQGLEETAKVLGDSPKRLHHTEIVPFFLGIALGVFVGSIPLPVPGLTASVKLGIAGGPLLVAIVLGRIGKIGPLHWFVPPGATYILREFGIVLFLCAVGLRSGATFVPTLLRGDGVYWMGLGALITLLPLIVVGFTGRIVFRLNYLTLCGLLSGSMTDPPALAFAGTMTGSENPYIAYATVYPLTMILRIVAAQILVILFAAN